MTFDPKKPVQTRDGRPARILCADRNDPSIPIVAAYSDAPGACEGISFHHADGTVTGSRPHCDLVNVLKKNKQYAVLYPRGLGGLYDKKEAAEHFQKTSKVSLGIVEIVTDESGVVDISFTPKSSE